MRKLFFLFILLVFAKISFTQINISIRSGANIATTKNLIAFPKNRLGWYAGVGAQIPVQERLFLQPELIYSSKGDKSDNQGSTTTVALRLNYINLPLLIGYRFDRKTSIVFGPELGYLVAARSIHGRNNNIDAINRYPPKFDVGASLGLQFRPINRTGIEIRYIYGANTLYSIDAVGARYSENKGANRVFQMGFTYVLHK